jgi:hypothetical protein
VPLKCSNPITSLPISQHWTRIWISKDNIILKWGITKSRRIGVQLRFSVNIWLIDHHANPSSVFLWLSPHVHKELTKWSTNLSGYLAFGRSGAARNKNNDYLILCCHRK